MSAAKDRQQTQDFSGVWDLTLTNAGIGTVIRSKVGFADTAQAE
jgi:hypothetical protein